MSNPPDVVHWGRFGEVQREITRWADEQFPGRTDHQTLYKLVLHEVPELLTHKKEHGIEGIDTELADCFILLLDLASMWKVDVEEAIRAKMEINYRRLWERDAHGIMQHVPESPLQHCTNPNMTKEAGAILAAAETGRCRFYPNCYCGHGPLHVSGIACPECKNTTTVVRAPPAAAYAYKCGTCGHEFDDDILF